MLTTSRFGRLHIFLLLLPCSAAIADYSSSVQVQNHGITRSIQVGQAHEHVSHIAPSPAAPNKVAVTPPNQAIITKPTTELALRPIFTLCVFMYGSIGLMWLARHYGAMNIAGNGFHTFLLCLTWCSMSIGMHVLNKTLAAKLHSPGLIAAAQMVIAVILVGGAQGKQLLEASASQLKYWMVVPMFFSAMLCSSFYTYEYISLCLLTVVRNLTPMVVLPIERLTMPADKRPEISPAVLGSLMVMLVGAVVYGGGIKEISYLGVGFAVFNMVLAASDRLIQRRLLTEECKGLPSGACTIINNTMGLVPTLGLVLVTGQASHTVLEEHATDWKDPQLMVILVLSGVVGIGICYLGFECQRVISATSFFVLQNASKVVVVCAGMTFFGDPITAGGMLGLSLSLGGSFLYSKAQFDLTDIKQKKAEAQALLDNKIGSEKTYDKIDNKNP